MRYMIAFLETADDFAKRQDPDAAGPYWGAWNAYMGAMGQAGIMVQGNGLLPPDTASTVRLRDGQREVHDGPFADTKEQLAGYCIIDVADLNAALDWAAKSPAALTGSVEVRPVMPPPDA